MSLEEATTMQLSRMADYGVRAMMDLASLPPESKALIPDIARRQDVPRAFLAKIIPRLAKEGLLHTQRGAAGGVKLGRPADEISLLEILQAVDGPIVLAPCSLEPENCSRSADCGAAPVWRAAQVALDRTLANTTLSDLVNNSAAGNRKTRKR